MGVGGSVGLNGRGVYDMDVSTECKGENAYGRGTMLLDKSKGVTGVGGGVGFSRAYMAWVCTLPGGPCMSTGEWGQYRGMQEV